MTNTEEAQAVIFGGGSWHPTTSRDVFVARVAMLLDAKDEAHAAEVEGLRERVEMEVSIRSTMAGGVLTATAALVAAESERDALRAELADLTKRYEELNREAEYWRISRG